MTRFFSEAIFRALLIIVVMLFAVNTGGCPKAKSTQMQEYLEQQEIDKLDAGSIPEVQPEDPDSVIYGMIMDQKWRNQFFVSGNSMLKPVCLDLE